MDIDTRKLSFVREFLRVSDEKLITKLEKVLHSERIKRTSRELEPMSMAEFNRMIDQSEEDHQKGKVTEARDLLKEVEKWK